MLRIFAFFILLGMISLALFCMPQEAGAAAVIASKPQKGENFSNLVGLKMIWVASGRFKMGSVPGEVGRSNNEGPCHWVEMRHGFWMSEVEVPQYVYEMLTSMNPSRFERSKWPVTNVTYDEAMDFCYKLNLAEKRAQRLPDGYEYSLPSESQWEYACRAGTRTARPVDLREGAWLFETCVKTGKQWEFRPREVGKKAPNPWGFKDMLGNVWEWCMDDYHPC